MALTKEDLQAIAELIQQSEQRIKIDMATKDDIHRIDGKLAGLQQGQADLRAEMRQDFKETRKAITDVVDAVDKKFEHLGTTA